MSYYYPAYPSFPPHPFTPVFPSFPTPPYYPGRSQKMAFRCRVCDRKFNDISALEQHFLDKKDHASCKTCVRCFVDKQALFQHNNSVHYSTFCNACKKAFYNESSLSQHFFGSPNHPKCRRCHLGFRNRADLYEHKRTEHASSGQSVRNTPTDNISSSSLRSPLATSECTTAVSPVGSARSNLPSQLVSSKGRRNTASYHPEIDFSVEEAVDSGGASNDEVTSTRTQTTIQTNIQLSPEDRLENHILDAIPLSHDEIVALETCMDVSYGLEASPLEVEADIAGFTTPLLDDHLVFPNDAASDAYISCEEMANRNYVTPLSVHREVVNSRSTLLEFEGWTGSVAQSRERSATEGQSLKIVTSQMAEGEIIASAPSASSSAGWGSVSSYHSGSSSRRPAYAASAQQGLVSSMRRTSSRTTDQPEDASPGTSSILCPPAAMILDRKSVSFSFPVHTVSSPPAHSGLRVSPLLSAISEMNTMSIASSRSGSESSLGVEGYLTDDALLYNNFVEGSSLVRTLRRKPPCSGASDNECMSVSERGDIDELRSSYQGSSRSSPSSLNMNDLAWLAQEMCSPDIRENATPTDSFYQASHSSSPVEARYSQKKQPRNILNGDDVPTAIDDDFFFEANTLTSSSSNAAGDILSNTNITPDFDFDFDAVSPIENGDNNISPHPDGTQFVEENHPLHDLLTLQSPMLSTQWMRPSASLSHPPPPEQAQSRTRMSSRTTNTRSNDSSHSSPRSPPRSSHRLHCRLCQADPCVNMTASLCGHIFCHSCITREIAETSRCPVCDTPMLLYCLFKLDLTH